MGRRMAAVTGQNWCFLGKLQAFGAEVGQQIVPASGGGGGVLGGWGGHFSGARGGGGAGGRGFFGAAVGGAWGRALAGEAGHFIKRRMVGAHIGWPNSGKPPTCSHSSPWCTMGSRVEVED